VKVAFYATQDSKSGLVYSVSSTGGNLNSTSVAVVASLQYTMHSYPLLLVQASILHHFTPVIARIGIAAMLSLSLKLTISISI
jgi:hypothetical protein